MSNILSGVNKYTLMTLGIVVVLVFAAYNYTNTSEDGTDGAITEKTSSSLVTEAEQYDFGTIDINGGNVTTEFPVTNTGAEAVVVTDGTTSCACTSAELSGVEFDMHNGMKKEVTIEPGETIILTATYDPLFHGPKGTGKITREIILKTNSVVTPEVRARFKVNVIKG